LFRMNSTKKGFTLVEVIIVLVIIAVLAAIAVPAMTGWMDRANERSSLIEARSIILAAEAKMIELYATTPGAIAKLDLLLQWSPYDPNYDYENDMLNMTNVVVVLAEVPGENVKKIVSSGPNVVELVYEKGNYRTTYTKNDGFSFEKL